MKDIEAILKELKQHFGVIGLRADMSSEICTPEELLCFKELSMRLGLEFTVKIGGCDAITDVFFAKRSDAQNLIAPMCETPYSVEKFVNACKYVYQDLNAINLYINIETATSYNNLDSILSSPYMENIKGIVLGRDDMAQSFGIPSEEINSGRMLELTKNIAQKVSLSGKEFVVGGGIRPKSETFLGKIYQTYLTKFETRRIIFDGSEILNENFLEGIKKAVEFEKMWLKYRNDNINPDFKNTEKRIRELNLSL